MDIGTLFLGDYFAMRQHFIKLANDNGFLIESFENPHKGPDDKPVFMDFASAGSEDAKSLLVIISGTHGPEGYCGSAIQSGLLKSGKAKQWANKHKILFVHAHNPFGFAWDVRFNEDNVDLNRNYLDDFTNLPENLLYDEIKDWAVPQDLSEDGLNYSIKNLMNYARSNGFQKLQSALTAGQYSHPSGVYYGGNSPTWSHLILKNHIGKYAECIDNIVFIDIHTGLGDYGKCELISSLPNGTIGFEKLHKIWGDEVKSSATGDSVSAKLNGCLDIAMMKHLGENRTSFIAAEFGTIDPISVFRATQAATWLLNNDGLNTELGEMVRAQNRAAFYPNDLEWYNSVWHKAEEIISKAVDNL